MTAERLKDEVLRWFAGALTIRHVDAGSCNGCELEIHAMNNPYYNLEGLGIRFVASPRHADMLLVTGPVSRHMEMALRRTYDATPEPRLVVAIGDCGCTGGIFGESYASCGRVSNVIPVDVAVPGCPPTPVAIMQGILTAIELRKPLEPHGQSTRMNLAGSCRLDLYEKLMRLDKPIGILLLLWPTLWALWLAARGVPEWTDRLDLRASGTVLMRSAGVRDQRLRRSRLRPACGAHQGPAAGRRAGRARQRR